MFRRRAEDEQRAEAEARSLTDPLHELSAGDEELRTALGYFILNEPERQIPLLGSISDLAAEAQAAIARGDRISARIDFEMAARIAIYNQDQENAKKMLTQADEISESDVWRKMRRKLLSSMGDVMRIARTYYEQRAKSQRS